jgi:hypothetical protein
VAFRGTVRTGIAGAGGALLLAGCASGATAVRNLSWKPPPQSAGCTEFAPCDNVKKWFAFETRSAGDASACHPIPQKGTEETCARADEAYARAHQEHLEYFAGLCGESVGVPSRVVLPYLGVPENDRLTTCGGKGVIAPFPCRVWEWTWATASKGGAFLVFLVQPAGGPPGEWVFNACSYCDATSSCREIPFRP